MTDSEKLDLLLEKVGDLERRIKELKRQQMKDTAELRQWTKSFLMRLNVYTKY